MTSRIRIILNGCEIVDRNNQDTNGFQYVFNLNMNGSVNIYSKPKHTDKYDILTSNETHDLTGNFEECMNYFNDIYYDLVCEKDTLGLGIFVEYYLSVGNEEVEIYKREIAIDNTNILEWEMDTRLHDLSQEDTFINDKVEKDKDQYLSYIAKSLVDFRKRLFNCGEKEICECCKDKSFEKVCEVKYRTFIH